MTLHYDICGHISDWFKKSLKDQKQFTHVKHVNSDLSLISCGVPQGSNLRSQLFISYMDDNYNISIFYAYYIKIGGRSWAIPK